MQWGFKCLHKGKNLHNNIEVTQWTLQHVDTRKNIKVISCYIDAAIFNSKNQRCREFSLWRRGDTGVQHPTYDKASLQFPQYTQYKPPSAHTYTYTHTHTHSQWVKDDSRAVCALEDCFEAAYTAALQRDRHVVDPAASKMKLKGLHYRWLLIWFLLCTFQASRLGPLVCNRFHTKKWNV